MKTKTILIALILGLVAFWGCDDNSTGPSGSSIIGSWEKQIEEIMLTVSFLDNGTFTTTAVEGDGVSGTYTLSGDEITFIDDVCGEDIEGNYIYSIGNDKLTFSLIEDNCEENRPEVISGTWTKK